MEGPTPYGYQLSDVQSVQDDEPFANLCYELVAQRTEPNQPPVVGSIAGGHKTMSAHPMTAFSVYARTQDRLSHVLLYPDELITHPPRRYPFPAPAGVAGTGPASGLDDGPP